VLNKKVLSHSQENFLNNKKAKHYDGLMNYCKSKFPFGVVEAINGTIKAVIRRGRGYQNMDYLLLKVQKEIHSRSSYRIERKAA
jgi:hypothetical protein